MERILVPLAIVSLSWARVLDTSDDDPGRWNQPLYQGDMVLNADQAQQVKDGSFGFGATTDKLWPTTIAYEYSDEIATSPKAVAAIQAAIKDYEHYTCLRFVNRTDEENYMYFYNGTDCSSYVGMNEGANEISMAEGCWSRRTAIHEIAHSLGEFSST